MKCKLFSLLALFLALAVTGCGDSKSPAAKIEAKLDKDGGVFMVYNPAHYMNYLKDYYAIVADTALNVLRTENPQAAMIGSMTHMVICEVAKASGFENITGLGESTRKTGEFDGEPVYRNIYLADLKKTETPTILSSMALQHTVTLDALGSLPSEAILAYKGSFPIAKLYEQVKKISVMPMLTTKAEIEFVQETGIQLMTFLEALEGETTFVVFPQEGNSYEQVNPFAIKIATPNDALYSILQKAQEELKDEDVLFELAPEQVAVYFPISVKEKMDAAAKGGSQLKDSPLFRKFASDSRLPRKANIMYFTNIDIENMTADENGLKIMPATKSILGSALGALSYNGTECETVYISGYSVSDSIGRVRSTATKFAAEGILSLHNLLNENTAAAEGE